MTFDSLTWRASAYSAVMSFNLWLSAEEERILERIMRHEGTRNKEQAVIKAIREKGASLDAEQQAGENPVAVAAGLRRQPVHQR